MFSPAFNSTIAMRSVCLNLLASSYAGENDRHLEQSPPKAKHELTYSQGVDWQISEMQNDGCL